MYRLVLLRHGQSQWNLENRFTGWKDVSLTDNGTKEAILAGKVMKKNNIDIDIIFSSILERAYKTAELAISSMNLPHLWDKNKNLILSKNESLNERNYGDLVGLNKEETAKKYGEEQVHEWRRSFSISPPGGESLQDVLIRVKPYFEKSIIPLLHDKNVLIAAHGNSLRALMIHLGLYKSEEISKIEIPTGKPFVIKYHKGEIISSNYIS